MVTLQSLHLLSEQDETPRSKDRTLLHLFTYFE